MSLGCSLDEKNNKGHSAIIQASCGGHKTLVQWLVEQGASIHQRDDVGNTSLLFAAWGGHITVMEWLLDNGASLDETSEVRRGWPCRAFALSFLLLACKGSRYVGYSKSQ
jgi:ankyrin repeat protein